LQGVDGVAGLAAANFDLALVDLGVFVVRVLFQDLVIQLAGFVGTVFQDEQLNIIFLDQHVVAMIFV